jgi:predicted amidohydrolase YtcJ
MISKNMLIPIILTGIILMSCGCAEKNEYIAYTNGKIYTMDKDNPVVDWLVVKEGKIVYAGDYEGLQDFKGGEIVDLQGKTVIPGLIDAHCHMNSLGKMLCELKVKGVASKE